MFFWSVTTQRARKIHNAHRRARLLGRRRLLLEQLEDRQLLDAASMLVANAFRTPDAVNGNVGHESDDIRSPADTHHTWLAQRDTPLIHPDQVFYLDTQGAAAVDYDGPITVPDIDVPQFSAEPFGLAGREHDILSRVINILNDEFSETGIHFTDQPPSLEVPFSAIYLGGDNRRFSDHGSFLGLAEEVDVRNQNPNDKAFVFSDNVAAHSNIGDEESAADCLVEVISHESAHLLGWSHPADDADLPALDRVALSIPTLLSPGDGSTGQSTRPTFNWSTVSGANTYRILIATSAAALPTGSANPVSSSSLLINSTASSTSFTPSAGTLTDGATYYWEVRAGNSTTGDGGIWSTRRSFTTQPAVLTTPSLTSPASGATGQATTPAFNWSAISGANNYRILVATTAAALPTGGADPVSSASLLLNATTSNTTYTPASGLLSNGSVYYWEVRAGNSSNGAASVWSGQRSFTTQPAVLTTPSLTSPASGATGQSTTPAFTWSAISGANNYRILVATTTAALPTGGADPVSSASLLLDTTTSNTTYTPASGLLSNGAVYYWEVRAGNSSNGASGIWSVNRSFTTVPGTPGGDQYENDNTASQAQPIVTGVTQIHSIHVVGDVDWVKFTLTAPSEVSIVTDSSFSNIKELTLFGPDDSSTQKTYTNDTYGIGQSARLFFNGSDALGVGTYYVRINELGNDATVSNYSLQVTITPAVSINLRGGGSGPIDPAKPTWVVVHGRTDSPDSQKIGGLVAAIDTFSTTDQVLVLDWRVLAADNSSAVGAVITGAEDWIKPVATWAASRLTTLGFAGANRNNLNLIGHSWGSYVCAEISERLGSVNTIVALDPARDGAGSYDPDHGEVDFKTYSQFSWAFHGTDLQIGVLAGSRVTPSTADEAFVMIGSNHSEVVTVFADLLSNTGARQYFGLEHVLNHVPGVWNLNRYDSDGVANTGGTYEAVLQTNGAVADSVTYFDSSGEGVHSFNSTQLTNGGFENGTLSGWTVTAGGQYPKLVTAAPASGTYALQLGDGGNGLGSGNTACIQQIVTIPAATVSPTLSLKYKVEGTDGEQYDWMKVYVNATQIASWSTDTSGWKTFTYDLSAFKGQSVTLKISSWTMDTIAPVNYFLDDISIVLANGGFENGTLSGWTVTAGGQFPKVVSGAPASEAYALQLGDGGSGLGGGNTASIQQTVTIVASTVAPTLSLKYKVEGTDGEQYDWMKIFVNATQIASWSTDTGGWKTFTYDLSAFKGQSVTLKISSWTVDTIAPVNYFLDDVSIIA
ncbi:MAG: hypothetical protein NTY19_50090 [Planctomycetota bacterium]|nr:hypothetical protein [Planctomycetota bacterium]